MRIKVLYILLFATLLIRFAYSDLVAIWTFNEGSGSYANDSTSFGNNCAVNNASWVSNGVQGDALDFNGFDSYLDCGNDTSLNFGDGNFTIMAWVKVHINAETPYYIDKWDAGASNEYCLGCGNNYFSGGVFNSTNQNNPVSTFAPTQNIWYHLVLVRNGTNLSIYVNGNLDTVAPSDGINADNAIDLIIGNNNPLDAPFNGAIDEVKIYNHSLSSDGILQIYNSEKYQSQLPAPEFPVLLIPVGIAAIAPILGYLITKKRNR